MAEMSETRLEAAADVREGAIALSRRLRSRRTAQALSAAKLGVLGRLRREGPATAGELAAAEHQLPQSLTRVFADLERDGLISRSRDAADGRQVVFALTDPGRRALADAVAEWDAWLASAMAGLSDVEREVLRLGARLMTRLAAADPPSRLAAADPPSRLAAADPPPRSGTGDSPPGPEPSDGRGDGV
ncbi:MarR family winged helix-turn-helix transcriptional regulator [Actinomadura rupiterrae]|uniref:MarR family winged helix-turn-helix transcriptional regulator n=1 Tax=Actinomadura rupiterrae TaxID=559627 RepID=UPI0020A4BCE4|nr:MarR family transcriptional regulator [Actinomadura rupiterrae]MCP2342262.1 DNA-binding MarR family transcriptional regulator [Actinomadura rupiterrae]